MEVHRAYKLKAKFIGTGRSMVAVPIPKRANLVVPALRRVDVDSEGKKIKRHLVLLFENGALYVFKQKDKFLVMASSGVLAQLDSDPCPAIESLPRFGVDFVVAVVEPEKPKVETVPLPKPPVGKKAPIVEAV